MASSGEVFVGGFNACQSICVIFYYVQAHYFGCISQLPRIVFSGPTINQNSMFNHDHEPKITLNPIYVRIFVGSVLPITWGLKPPTKCPMISFLLLVIFPAIHPVKSYILWIKSSEYIVMIPSISPINIPVISSQHPY